MRPRARSVGSHRPTRLWWIAAAALVSAGSGCLVLGHQDHRHPLAGPVATLPRAVTPRGAPAKGATTVATVRSTPLELTIPAISLSVSLGTLGLEFRRDGASADGGSTAGLVSIGPFPRARSVQR